MFRPGLIALAVFGGLLVLPLQVAAAEQNPDELFADLFDDMPVRADSVPARADSNPADSDPLDIYGEFDAVDAWAEQTATEQTNGSNEPTIPVSARFPGYGQEPTVQDFVEAEEFFGNPSRKTQTSIATSPSIPSPVVDDSEPAWMQLRTKRVAVQVITPVVLRQLAPRAVVDASPNWTRERDFTDSVRYTTQSLRGHTVFQNAEVPSKERLKRVADANPSHHPGRTNSITNPTRPTTTKVEPIDLKKAFAPIAAFASAFKSPRVDRTQEPIQPKTQPPSRKVPKLAPPTRIRAATVVTSDQVPTSRPTPTGTVETNTTPEETRVPAELHTEPADVEPSIEELLLLDDSLAVDATGDEEVSVATPNEQESQVATEPPIAAQPVGRIWHVMSWLPILLFIPILLLLHKKRKQRDDRESRRLRAAQANLQFPTSAEKRMEKMVQADVQVSPEVAQPVAVAEVAQQLEAEIDRSAATTVAVPDDSAPNPDWLTLGQSLVDEEITAAEKAASGSPDDFAMPETTADTISPSEIKLPIEDEWAFDDEPEPIKQLKPTDGYVSEDLKKLHGIGPAIEKVLHKAKIYRYSDLAATDAAELLEMLRNAGHPFNTVDPTTWAVQAALAMDGDWGRLVLYKMHENAWDVPGADLAAVPANDMMNDLAAMMADLQASVAKKANTVPATTTEEPNATASAIDFDSFME